jgi:hypothetical protein
VNRSVQLNSLRSGKHSFPSVEASGPLPVCFARNQVKKSCSRQFLSNAAVKNMNRTRGPFKAFSPAGDVQLTIANECRYSRELPVACHIVRLPDVIKMISDNLYVSTNAAPSN